MTTMTKDEIVEVLNDLLETSMDGELGFDNGAKYVKSPALREVFHLRAEDCRRGSEEMRTLISTFGGNAKDGGTASGALHRGWLNVRGALTGHSDTAMLEECERGEDAAKARYAAALQKELPENVRSIVQRQYDGVLRNHDQIHILRDEARQHP